MAKTLLTNANLFGNDLARLRNGTDVIVNGNRIEAVSATPLSPGDAVTIDVAGKTLMPGLIDAHAHITGLSLSPKNIACSPSEITAAAANYLRNTGGADYSIARLVVEGTIVGPRLFYSGRALTQTGGGADFRTPGETLDPHGQSGPFSVMSVIVDGVDEVRKAAREELRRGASQIKLFASGGLVFPSEAHATLYEFSLEELRAAVEEAKSRGTYVMAHVYTDEGVRRCLFWAWRPGGEEVQAPGGTDYSASPSRWQSIRRANSGVCCTRGLKYQLMFFGAIRRPCEVPGRAPIS